MNQLPRPVPEPYKPVIPAPKIPKEFGKRSTIFDRNIDRFPSKGGGGGGSPIQFPFQLLNKSVTGDSPVAKINVRYGTLQDVAPTNIGTDITLTAGTWTFYLDLEIDIDGVFVAATLSHADTGQPPDEDYHGYITLGEADVSDDAVTAIRLAATHSLRYAMCGRVVTDGVLIARGTYEFWGF